MFPFLVNVKNYIYPTLGWCDRLPNSVRSLLRCLGVEQKSNCKITDNYLKYIVNVHTLHLRGCNNITNIGLCTTGCDMINCNQIKTNDFIGYYRCSEN